MDNSQLVLHITLACHKQKRKAASDQTTRHIDTRQWNFIRFYPSGQQPRIIRHWNTSRISLTSAGQCPHRGYFTMNRSVHRPRIECISDVPDVISLTNDYPIHPHLPLLLSSNHPQAPHPAESRQHRILDQDHPHRSTLKVHMGAVWPARVRMGVGIRGMRWLWRDRMMSCWKGY